MKRYLLSVILLFIYITVFSSPVGAIFVPNQIFSNTEIFTLSALLDSNQISYYIFSDKAESCTGNGGYKIEPFTVLDSVNKYPMDFLILIGGAGVYNYLENVKLLDLIKEADKKGLLIGAISNAPLLLIKSEILKGRAIAITRNDVTEEIMLQTKTAYFADNVVVAGNIITSSESQYARNFAKVFIKKLNETFNPKGK